MIRQTTVERERREQPMGGFVQIIEFQTSRIDEIRRLGEEMQPQRAEGTVRKLMMTADRDRPGHYVTIVEFDSYESAMENSNRPETSEFAGRMAELCDGPPTFTNLDVSQVWER
jgi:quinol monooxygenase YgiN